MGMIKPSVGRVMLYWPQASERGEQPWAALVTHVHSDNMVNLAAFFPDGGYHPTTSVPVVQDGSPYTKGDSPYAEWMPYQLGQAAKTEAVQKGSPEQARVGHSLGKLVHAMSDILRVSYPHLDPLHDELSKNAVELVHTEKPPASTGL